MKKLILGSILAVAFCFPFHVFAQKANKFKGTIVMQAEGNGRTSESSYKVFEDKLYISADQYQEIIVNRDIVYGIINFSEIFTALQAGGVELEGTGKMYIKDQFIIDSVLKNTTVDYTSETKKINDFNTKKAIVKLTNEEGERYEIEVWYSDEIGPEYNARIMPYVKGFPLEVTVKDTSGEVATKVTVKSIEKGKVKEAQFLLPSGYKEVSREELGEIISTIQEAVGSGE